MIIKAIYRLPKKARNLLFLKVTGVATATFLNQNEHTILERSSSCHPLKLNNPTIKSTARLSRTPSRLSVMFFLIHICDWNNSVDTNLNS